MFKIVLESDVLKSGHAFVNFKYMYLLIIGQFSVSNHIPILQACRMGGKSLQYDWVLEMRKYSV